MSLQQYFSPMEEKEACSSLISTQREDSTENDQKFNLPPINFYHLPKIKCVVLFTILMENIIEFFVNKNVISLF